MEDVKCYNLKNVNFLTPIKNSMANGALLEEVIKVIRFTRAVR